MAETNGLWGWWTTSRNTPAGCEKGLKAIKLVCFTDAEHNGKTNVILEFERSVKVRHQVVARTMHHFTVEVKEASSGKKLYKAKVWAEELQAPAELRAHWGCRSHLT